MQINSITSASSVCNTTKIKNTNSYNYKSQVSFGDSFATKTKQKGVFQSIIQKLGLNNQQKDTTITNVFTTDANNPYNSELAVNIDMIAHFSEKCAINPFENHFIMHILDDNNFPIVIFNSFSEDNDGKEKMQLFVMYSDSDKLTDTQKAAYKLFYDESTRHKLQKGSFNNPLKDIDDTTLDVNKTIKREARKIQSVNWAKYCEDARRIDPVIYSADGQKKYWFNPKNI